LTSKQRISLPLAMTSRARAAPWYGACDGVRAARAIGVRAAAHVTADARRTASTSSDHAPCGARSPRGCAGDDLVPGSPARPAGGSWLRSHRDVGRHAAASAWPVRSGHPQGHPHAAPAPLASRATPPAKAERRRVRASKHPHAATATAPLASRATPPAQANAGVFGHAASSIMSPEQGSPCDGDDDSHRHSRSSSAATVGSRWRWKLRRDGEHLRAAVDHRVRRGAKDDALTACVRALGIDKDANRPGRAAARSTPSGLCDHRADRAAGTVAAPRADRSEPEKGHPTPRRQCEVRGAHRSTARRQQHGHSTRIASSHLPTGRKPIVCWQSLAARICMRSMVAGQAEAAGVGCPFSGPLRWDPLPARPAQRHSARAGLASLRVSAPWSRRRAPGGP
jgi:hypothetical protein